MKHFDEHVDGSFNFKGIYDSVLAEAHDGAVFVQVGSWYGRSAAYMAVEIASARKHVDFYCVDTWVGSTRGGSALPFFEENMRPGCVLNFIRVIPQHSVVAASSFQPESLDFVMIDGAQDYASVRADVRAWITRVKPDGVIAGDDADWPGVLIGTYETIPCSEVEILNNGANWRHRKARPARGSWMVCRAAPPSVDYLTYIPYVNRPDLLDRAVASIPDLWPSLVVIDQSAEGLKSRDHPWIDEIGGVFRSQPRSMSFSQMMNWAQAEAFCRRAKHLIFMHNDAECLEGVPLRVLDYARAHPRSGVVFTHYDAFAVFNVEARSGTPVPGTKRSGGIFPITTITAACCCATGNAVISGGRVSFIIAVRRRSRRRRSGLKLARIGSGMRTITNTSGGSPGPRAVFDSLQRKAVSHDSGKPSHARCRARGS